MKKFSEIIKSPDYWLEKFQNEVFRVLSKKMKNEKKSQSEVAKDLKVSKSYVSQVLNGNFNFTLKKLIELSLYVGVVPVIDFVPIEKYILNQKENSLAKNETITVNPTQIYVVKIDKFINVNANGTQLSYASGLSLITYKS